MARTSTKKDNRERARQRRAELDAERARRDAAIEEAASTFFDANDDREELIAKLDAIDVDRALAVQSLVELKETNPRIAQLLDIPVAEVRRLRDLGAEVPRTRITRVKPGRRRERRDGDRRVRCWRRVDRLVPRVAASQPDRSAPNRPGPACVERPHGVGGVRGVRADWHARVVAGTRRSARAPAALVGASSSCSPAPTRSNRTSRRTCSSAVSPCVPSPRS
jgi:hypothetical protein